MDLRQYVPWLIASVIGAALVTIVAITTGNMTAVLLTGLGAGIVAGGVISTSQRKQGARPAKRRRRR